MVNNHHQQTRDKMKTATTSKHQRMIERAIDRLIDLKDEGFGCQEFEQALSKLRQMGNTEL